MIKSILTALAAMSFAVSGNVAAASVSVKGSDTMVILAQRWAEEFMKKHPEAKIQVTGGGSGVGIAALINGTTDIATASRPMKDAEKATASAKFHNAPLEISVAKDGVTFYVHEKNPVSALTMEQLKSIYLGDITNWKQVGGKDEPLTLYSRENSSGTYEFVKEKLLGNEDYASNAQTLPGTAAVVNAVAKDPRGIGYGGAAYAKGIKELKIKVGAKEISPTAAEVKSHAYPLSRDLYFYLPHAATGDQKAFIDYVLSADGQALATKVGYYPLK